MFADLLLEGARVEEQRAANVKHFFTPEWSISPDANTAIFCLNMLAFLAYSYSTNRKGFSSILTIVRKKVLRK